MNYSTPTVLERIQSTLIDSVVIIAGIILISEILTQFENVPDEIRILLFVLLFLYEPICTTLGGTLGNHKMGIRVRQNANPEKRINLIQAIIRYGLKIALSWMSFLSIFISPKSRTIHDMVSGSVMVKTEV